MPETQNIHWFFDFISPFAYFQHHRLQQLRADRPDIKITPIPVLFAGLLKQFQHKGPAEIPSKRVMTYQYCNWYAAKNNIPFAMPHSHPFNPLPMLRLSIANQNKVEVIDKLFKHIWVDSADNPEFFTLDSISDLAHFGDAATETARQEVKNQLIENTEQAIKLGIFGVPTIAIGTQLFWGLDMTEMALEYLDHPLEFGDDEYQRLLKLPVAKARI